MKRARLLLLIFPLVVGALYLRSVASWRPKKVFISKSPITEMVLSDDGRTLLIVQDQAHSTTVTALDTTQELATKWRRQGDINTPQFFAADTRIVAGLTGQILDAETGKTLDDLHGTGDRLLSPDGRWLIEAVSLKQNSLQYVGNKLHLPPSVPVGQQATKLVGYKNDIPLDQVFTQDSKSIVVAVGTVDSSRLDLYDVQTGKRTNTYDDMKWTPNPSYATFTDGATLCWSPDGHYLAAFWCRQRSPLPNINTVSIWRMNDHHKLASLKLPDSGESCSVARQALESSTSNRVLLFQLPTLSLGGSITHAGFASKQWFDFSQETITDTTLSPDGSSLFVATQSGRVYQQRLK